MDKDKTDETDKTHFGLNEWGIPDWRDPAAYGDVSSWTIDRWRWEFYRRRDDLRACFDRNAEYRERLFRRMAGRHGYADPPLRRDDPGFTTLLNAEEQRAFGYHTLPNPRIGQQPEPVIRSRGNDSYVLVHSPIFQMAKEDHPLKLPPPPPPTIEALLDFCLIQLSEADRIRVQRFLHDYHMPVGPRDVAIIFNLDRPMKPQIEAARATLKQAYSRVPSPRQKRRHIVKWLGYLRTLDAREAGASWREISAIHPQTVQTEQAARDIWDAANALRFNF